MENDSRKVLESLASEVNIEERSAKNTASSKPITSTPKKKGIKKGTFYIILFTVLIITLVAIGFIFYSTRNKDSDNSNNQNEEVSEGEEENSENETPEVVQRDILYLTDVGIYKMSEDGKSPILLVEQSNDEIFSNIGWMDSDSIFYTSCIEGEGCDLNTFTIENEIAKTIVSISGASSIPAVSWSPTNEMFVYLYIDDDDVRVLEQFKSTRSLVERYSGEILGRGGSLDDMREIIFSPDESKYVLINTIVADDEKSIIIFDIEGDMISEVDESYATNAVWLDSSRILFKSLGILYELDIAADSTSEILNPFNYYDLAVDKEGRRVLSWAFENNGDTSSWIYEPGENNNTLLIPDFIYGKWLDQNTVIGRISVPAEGLFPFEATSLAKYDIEDNEFQVLTSENILEFSIQPD
jgi:hypothetical protein